MISQMRRLHDHLPAAGRAGVIECPNSSNKKAYGQTNVDGLVYSLTAILQSYKFINIIFRLLTLFFRRLLARNFWIDYSQPYASFLDGLTCISLNLHWKSCPGLIYLIFLIMRYLSCFATFQDDFTFQINFSTISLFLFLPINREVYYWICPSFLHKQYGKSSRAAIFERYRRSRRCRAWAIFSFFASRRNQGSDVQQQRSAYHKYLYT